MNIEENLNLCYFVYKVKVMRDIVSRRLKKENEEC